MGIVVLLYLAANLTYLCAVPITDMPRVARVAEAAVSGSTGPAGAAIISGMILISILGALNGSALSGGRIPYAAAVDGLFPAFLAKIHARYRTPAWALLTQGLLTVLLIVVFTALGIAAFDKITDMVIFAEGGFYALCAAAVLILRRRDPQRPRPYLAWGYPWSQWVFIAAAIWLCFNSLIAAPMQSLLGLGLIALGLPFYRRRATGSVTEA
jgi:APA family basic amino acid/polyamine antiporter